MGNVCISTDLGTQLSPQNSRKPPKIKFESKGILVFSLTSLILLRLSQTKEDK